MGAGGRRGVTVTPAVIPLSCPSSWGRKRLWQEGTAWGEQQELSQEEERSCREKLELPQPGRAPRGDSLRLRHSQRLSRSWNEPGANPFLAGLASSSEGCGACGVSIRRLLPACSLPCGAGMCWKRRTRTESPGWKYTARNGVGAWWEALGCWHGTPQRL